ncbi:MAG: ThuA domain-containing protein [Planctomycetota bacterium]|nr:MAG: ThuA domain-containing protein [Planctomycetota bacterium]
MLCTSENGNASCFQRRRRFVGWLVVLIVCWGTSRAAADEGLAPKTTEGESPDVKRVLLVTGEDYPGHKWKETTPVLAKAIGGDERLQIEIAWETTALTRDDLAEYDGIVLHFKNYDPNVPGPKARKNLERFVADGGGLVLVHFACGAFQEWPEFERLAGRVWDPKLRGHDPHGPFTVHIVDHAHPITHAMEDFETVDELYTCLAGKTPIRVLANATSKVEGKAYPMAFVLEYGKGRVFHSPLGHDVKALSVPEVAALFRRGTAWSVGLDPQ